MSDAELAALRRGERSATWLAETASGYAVLGYHQKLPGYCLLIHRGDVEHLEELPAAERALFLDEVALLGRAVRAALAGEPGLRRLNYEILGNRWEHLHAHVFPRYDWEPEPYRSGPVWRYPDLQSDEHLAGPGTAALRERIALELQVLLTGGG